MQDTPHSAGAAHTEAELWAGVQRVPPRTRYSHTTASNLKRSPLAEICPRSIYSTGMAGRGSGSSAHGAPAVHGAPALGPARSLPVPAPHYPYPYTDKRFAWVRTKLEACEGCGHCHMLQWGCPHTEDAGGGSSGTCCTVGLSRGGIRAAGVAQNHLRLHSEGGTGLGPVFTADVSPTDLRRL